MKNGQIKHIFIKPSQGAAMLEMDRTQAVAEMGLENDLAFGKKSRQILIIETETLEDFKLQPGQIRENIVVENLNVSDLPIGTRLISQDVILEINGECAPCDFLNSVSPGLMEDIRGRRGVFASVIQGGALVSGAKIQVA